MRTTPSSDPVTRRPPRLGIEISANLGRESVITSDCKHQSASHTQDHPVERTAHSVCGVVQGREPRETLSKMTSKPFYIGESHWMALALTPKGGKWRFKRHVSTKPVSCMRGQQKAAPCAYACPRAAGSKQSRWSELMSRPLYRSPGPCAPSAAPWRRAGCSGAGVCARRCCRHHR